MNSYFYTWHDFVGGFWKFAQGIIIIAKHPLDMICSLQSPFNEDRYIVLRSSLLSGDTGLEMLDALLS